MNIEIPSDLYEKVAQLFIIRASGHTFDSQRQYPQWELSNSEINHLITKGIGGVIFFGGTCSELFDRCRTFQNLAKIPLLLCADVEEGMGQRFEGASYFLPPMSIAHIYSTDPNRAIKLARMYGKFTADQAIACGLNWILAPVCDVNTNSNNPVINMRAWGENPSTVSSLTCAFYRGLSTRQIFSCAKHFPGHGDTGVDSHQQLPILQHDLERLEEIDLVPFRELISEGIDSIMIGHLLLKKIDSLYPSSLSFEIVTKLLRQKLGFDGLVVTDALVMNSISQHYGGDESAVKAFQAGVDLILMPNNPTASIQAICEAICTGKIPMKRLEQSLARRRKLFDKKNTTFSGGSVKNQTLQSLESNNQEVSVFTQELINKSSRFINSLEVAKVTNGINLIRIDESPNSANKINTLPIITLPQEAGFRPIVLQKYGINPWTSDFKNPLNLDLFDDEPIFLQIFFRGKPFLHPNVQKEPWKAVVKQLQSHKRLSGLIIYGSHYLWDDLVNILDSDIPAAYTPGQLPDAQIKVLSRLFESKNLQVNNNIHVGFTD